MSEFVQYAVGTICFICVVLAAYTLGRQHEHKRFLEELKRFSEAKREK